jgi:hypothetical protein
LIEVLLATVAAAQEINVLMFSWQIAVSRALERGQPFSKVSSVAQ